MPRTSARSSWRHGGGARRVCAAAAEAAGFRACLRCRPYRLGGPVAANAPELVCRAVRLIIDGVLDDGTEPALATRVGVSARHLRRMFAEHLGVTPDQLARSRRAHFARRLLDDSDLTVADVAFASGFGSLRQFNRAMVEVFRAAPSELRSRRRRADRLATDGGLTMRLPCQPPFDWDRVVGFLGDRAVPGVEPVNASGYRRTISLDGEPGVLEVYPGGHDHLLLRAHLPLWEGLIHVVERVSRLFGIGADVGSGQRIPGAWGPLEVAVHAILAQHGGRAAASEHAGTLVRRFGQPIPGLPHGLTHLFPSAEVLADADLAGVPGAGTIRALAAGTATGALPLDDGLTPADLMARLTALPELRAATAHQLALRLG